MKRILSLLISVLLALGVMPFAVAEDELDDMWIGEYELTYWTPIDFSSAQIFDTYAEHPFYKWLEEQTGVHVTFIHPAEEQMDQQFNLMISSGQFYDILCSPGYMTADTEELLDEGVFANIYDFEEIMPHYFEAIRCTDGSYNAWEWGEEKEFMWDGYQPPFEPGCRTATGRLWCVSQVWSDAWPTECGALIRKDWLDDLGLGVPKTITELETVLAAFRGMGEDIIPMTLGQNGCNATSGYLCTAFDILPSWYTVTDGVVDPLGWTTESGREYLTLLRDWYSKGYIDPDFMNRDFQACEALLLNDRLGMLTETYSTPDYYKSIYAGNDEDFELVPVPLVRKDLDQTLRYKLSYDSTPIIYDVICGLNENKEIAAKWLDKHYTEAAMRRGSYGVEGESYETDENGVPYFTDWFYEHFVSDDLYHTYLIPNMPGYTSTRAYIFEHGNAAPMEVQKTTPSPYAEVAATWGDNAVAEMYIGYLNFEGDGWSEMYDLYVEAETYALPMVLKMITGQEDIANFDVMAQKALDIGWREARDLTQICYNRQQNQTEGYGLD